MLAINTDYIESYDDPRPYLEQIAEAGFSHVHWCHEWGSDRLYSEEEIAQIARWLQTYGLAVNDLHASSGKTKHYYAEDDAAHQAGVELVKNRIHTAHKLGTDVIVLHLPAEPGEAAQNTSFWSRFHHSMDALIPYARERGVRIAIENLYPANHKTLERVLAEYDPQDVGICYDSGHGNIVGDGLDFLDEVKDRLIAFHLNDNDGSWDQHNPIFSATVDWERLARIIAASGYHKQHLTMELTIRYSGIEGEAEFFAKSIETGEKFIQMIAAAKNKS